MAVTPQKRAALHTLGCRVNQYDTQAMKEQAEQASFLVIPFNSRADIYVINTCTVTAAADAEITFTSSAYGMSVSEANSWK